MMLADVVDLEAYAAAVPVRVSLVGRNGKPALRPVRTVLDLEADIEDSLDEHLQRIDQCVKRVHCASRAMWAAKPGSWAHDYWGRVHSQLCRRRESLDIPWANMPKNEFRESLCGTLQVGFAQ